MSMPAHKRRSVEERVFSFMEDMFPTPVLADVVCRKCHTNPSAAAAVIQRLYEKKLIVAEGGGFLVAVPRKYRSIDASWEA